MATDIIEFAAPSGLNLDATSTNGRVDLFILGSDTVAAYGTALAATERTNDLRRYRTNVVTPTAGWHRVKVRQSSTAGDFVGDWWVYLKNDGSVCLCGDRVPELETDGLGNVLSKVQAVLAGALTAAAHAAGAFDAVWTVASRLLTAGTNIVLAKGVGVTGFNDLSAAQVNTEADTALADAGVTTVRMAHLDADISSRMATFTYTAPLDAAGTRTAIGLASANLDSQLDAIPTAAENQAQMDASSVALAAIYARDGTILGRVDVATSTRMATFVYTAPDNAGIAAVNALVAALNNLSAAGAQTAAGAALDARGFTSGRGPLLDRLDAAVTSRAVAGDAMTLTAGERTALRDAIWKAADYLETGKSPFDALRYIAAAVLGVYVPGDTSTFAAFGNPSTPRISAATPSTGGRTSVSLV